jgi:imidazoleglycerol phosphate dehydratase HisB
MAIDFASMLTNDQKRQLIENRLQQFAAEAYQYTLNKKTAEGIESESQIEAADKALVILEEAIKVHQAELDTIPVTETE